MKMIRTIAIAFAALALSGAAHAQHSHSPKHGGVVTEHKVGDLELVARPDLIQLHVRDHDGKPLDVSKATAKLTLLAGKDRQEVELKPAGAMLEARGTFKVDKGARAVALVRGLAKGDVTVRFAIP